MFQTAADVLKYFAVPAERIRLRPRLGRATGRDLLRIKAKDGYLCELVAGTLVQKPMSFGESLITTTFSCLIGNHVLANDFGIVVGPGGPVRLAKGLVRMPDVGFYGWHHFPNHVKTQEDIPRISPDLAVEVISPKNTRMEMARKLREYFKAGTKLVWYVYPKTKTVDVYTSPTDVKTLTVKDTLTGGDVLPGFKAKVAKVFA